MLHLGSDGHHPIATAGTDPRENAQRAAILQLRRLVEDLSLATQGADPSFTAMDAGHFMHGIGAGIGRCVHAGVDGPSIAELVRPAREVHRSSPFVRRLQEWPRGYPGDFETIEYLVRGENHAPKSTVAYGIESYALQSPMAQQHRNKIVIQAEFLHREIACRQRIPRTGPVSALVIACGSAPDVRAKAWALRDLDCHITLNDVDADALAFSRLHLADLADKCSFVHGNCFRALSSTRRVARCDVVVAGGLCDYLGDRQVQSLVGIVRDRVLRPGGVFLLTNIAEANPHRTWMEYMASWHLIERSEADLMTLLSSAGIPRHEISISREQTGLTLVAQITKP